MCSAQLFKTIPDIPETSTWYLALNVETLWKESSVRKCRDAAVTGESYSCCCFLLSGMFGRQEVFVSRMRYKLGLGEWAPSSGLSRHKVSSDVWQCY